MRRRVFCMSMGDAFEDREDLRPHRDRLWPLIRSTGALDWLVLTKRPEDIERLGDAETLRHCWLGVTVENQAAADERIPQLIQRPAVVRFLSCEPLLEPIDLTEFLTADLPEPLWVIVGGESKRRKWRPCDPKWIRDIALQCDAVGVPVFVKQAAGPRPETQGDIPDDLWRRKEVPVSPRADEVTAAQIELIA